MAFPYNIIHLKIAAAAACTRIEIELFCLRNFERNWRECLIGDDGNNKYRLGSSTAARAIAMSKWKLSDRFFHRSLRLVDVCRRWLFLLHRRLLFLRKWQHKGNARVNFHPIVLLSAALSPCGINYEMLCERKTTRIHMQPRHDTRDCNHPHNVIIFSVRKLVFLPLTNDDDDDAFCCDMINENKSNNGFGWWVRDTRELRMENISKRRNAIVLKFSNRHIMYILSSEGSCGFVCEFIHFSLSLPPELTSMCTTSLLFFLRMESARKHKVLRPQTAALRLRCWCQKPLNDERRSRESRVHDKKQEKAEKVSNRQTRRMNRRRGNNKFVKSFWLDGDGSDGGWEQCGTYKRSI